MAKRQKFQVVFLKPEMMTVEMPRPIDAERWAEQVIRRKREEDNEEWRLYSIEPVSS